MCRKPKFGSDLVLKNRTIQKFEICSAGFPTNCMQSVIQIKSD